ncbi:MAG: hypothetical protein ACT4NX_06300 [Deltaproteobacteria bacterium]
MNDKKIEALLERIAAALERMAGIQGITQVPRDIQANHLPQEEQNPGDTPLPAPSESGLLEAFLASKGITIKALPPEDAADQVIDSLSMFLGERYDALSELLAKIKRGMQTGTSITLSLKDYSQQDVSSVCQFCTRIHEIAFLEQYRYFRSPEFLIRAKTTTLPKAQRFFGGQWLERFILQKIKYVHTQILSEVGKPINFEFLINPQIVLPNGNDFELDVLVAMGSAIYWVEAKSGDYQQHTSKYSKFARTLGLDADHSIMALTDAADSNCEALSALFSMTVCNLKSFKENFLAIARSDHADVAGMQEP